MTGHLLGASEALGTVVSVRALREGLFPPTINPDQPDPGMKLDIVRDEKRHLASDVAVVNPSGFGGHNVALDITRT